MREMTQWLEAQKIKNYSVVRGGINVEGDVHLSDKGLTQIPYKFNVVTGNFNCEHNLLENLKNFPETVGGSLNVGKNQLLSLQGSPKCVLKNFDCSNNSLKSLVGGPEKVGGYFDCNNNKLSTLEGAPQVGGDFISCDNELVSLLGCQKEIYGNFICMFNHLKSLLYAPKLVHGYCAFNNNQLEDIYDFPHTKLHIVIRYNPKLKEQQRITNYETLKVFLDHKKLKKLLSDKLKSGTVHKL